VTRKSVVVGNYVQVGQQLMAIVPHEVWVTANFKETQLPNMKPGQPVQISVDAFPDVELHGQVQSIQRGSGAVFSLLPPQNATGNYVKVVQRVPVKITFDDIPQGLRLSPGMSVEPTVKVR
jgi:membrane fusion protein (multidrug efflux system)